MRLTASPVSETRTRISIGADSRSDRREEREMWLQVTLVAILAVVFLVRLTMALRHRQH